MLDLLRSDPKTSEEEHFKLSLVSTEVERVKYLVRSYLRCRLDKVSQQARDNRVWTRLTDVDLYDTLSLWTPCGRPSGQVERYSYHITLTPSIQSRLSELELNHARQ